MGKIFNVKTILWLFIIIGAGYLSSKFHDEAVLVVGISMVLVIGVWLLQVEKKNE